MQSICMGQSDSVYQFVEKAPSFPGGDAAYLKFIVSHFNHDLVKSRTMGQLKIYAAFIVDTVGSISNIKIVKGVNNTLDGEVVRVLQLMPRWIPGEQDGSLVNVQCTAAVNLAPFNIIDTVCLPAFPGGLVAMQYYINQKMKDVANAESAIIEVSLNVSETGKVKKLSLTREARSTTLNDIIYKAFETVQLNPETFNGVNVASQVLFDVFIEPQEEVIVDYAPDSSMFISKGKIACLTGLLNAKRGNFNTAIALYKFADWEGYNQGTCYFNIAVAYFNMGDSVNACKNWEQAKIHDDTDAEKYLEKYCNKKPQGDLTAILTSNNQKREEQTFSIVEVMPKFPDGGEEGFIKYISKNFNYPAYEKANKIQGTVFIEFVLRQDGSVTDVNVLKGIRGGKGLDAEAVRVVMSSPKWINGTQNGRPVAVYYRVPVVCTLH